MGAPEPSFPLQEFLGLTVQQGAESATASLDLDERHHNPNGVCHGAVPFALMDTVMGGAVMAVVEEGQICATIEMHTRFHRPVQTGRLVAHATVIQQGRRVIHLEARTTGEDGRLIASATASFAVIDPASGPSAVG